MFHIPFITFLESVPVTALRCVSSMNSTLPDNIETPSLRRLYAYWNERRRGRELPSRRDIDPLDFPYVLGHIMLLDVMQAPLRFRFRVYGTRLASRVGYDMTGKMADDVPNAAHRAALLERCSALVKHRTAVALLGQNLVGERMVGYEALWLPLSDDGTNVTMLLGGFICQNRRGSTRDRPDSAA